MNRTLAIVVPLLAACGGDGSSAGDPTELHAIIEARATMPTMFALHKKVISRSCSPLGGVCHNNREYPDLHTPANLIAAIGMPCNAARFGEPQTIFDGCEPEADELVADDSGWRASIAVFGEEEWSTETRSLFRRFALDAPASARLEGTPVHIERSGELMVSLPYQVRIEAGSTIGSIIDLETVDHRLLQRIRGGDPNRNGVVGSHDPWRLIVPERPDRSYLVARILGLVPGAKMPLANQSVSEAELAAIFCWIETFDGRSDVIDYDRCDPRRLADTLASIAE